MTNYEQIISIYRFMKYLPQKYNIPKMSKLMSKNTNLQNTVIEKKEKQETNGVDKDMVTNVLTKLGSGIIGRNSGLGDKRSK